MGCFCLVGFLFTQVVDMLHQLLDVQLATELVELKRPLFELEVLLGIEVAIALGNHLEIVAQHLEDGHT